MCILCNLRKNMEDVSHQCWQNETDRFHFKYVILWTVQPLIITVLLTEFNFCIIVLCYYWFIAHFRTWNGSKWARVKTDRTVPPSCGRRAPLRFGQIAFQRHFDHHGFRSTCACLRKVSHGSLWERARQIHVLAEVITKPPAPEWT